MNNSRKTLMFSYGMNTNQDQMAERCPDAVSLGAAVLPGYRFEFKLHATIVPDVDNEVHGVLWEITDHCEQMLDLLEGYPNYYTKQYVKVLHQGEYITAMTYLMHDDTEIMSPGARYFRIVYEGYMQHRVPTEQLLEAKTRADHAHVVHFS